MDDELMLWLLNMMPFQIVSYLCDIMTFYSCTPKNKNFRYVAVVILIKMILINMIYYFVLIGISGSPRENVLRFIVFLCDMIFITLAFYIFKIALNIPWEKISVIVFLMDCRSLLCAQTPIWVTSYLAHYDFMEYFLKHPFAYNNMIAICMALFMLCFTQIIGKELWMYVRRVNLKRPGLWKFFLAIYVFWGSYVCSNLNWFDSVGHLIIFGTIIAFGIFIFREKRKRLLEMSNRYLLLQQNMILQYYESLKEQINLTKKMRHDINNHMQIIESIRKENSTEELEAYTKKLREQYEQLEPVYYCDNVVINALIANKAEKCRNENIRFEAQFEELTLGEITEFDLASVLFNLLDNAIESCQKVEDETKRFIRLSCFTEAGQIVLHVVNSCAEKESKEKGRFFTSKPDKKRHGIGMGIVRENVTKYEGSMELSHQNYRFEVIINIPKGTS